jgi:hypothetical protein
MISLKTILQKFGEKGEKTGWTYITISEKIADKIKPSCKKSFRVKGFIDAYEIKALAVVPMGDGSFILPVNGVIRKAIKKIHGASVEIKLEEDDAVLILNETLMNCFKDDPDADEYFKSLPPSHQHWFSNWVNGAKTEITASKRIAAIIRSCAQKLTFAEMMHAYRDDRKF